MGVVQTHRDQLDAGHQPPNRAEGGTGREPGRSAHATDGEPVDGSPAGAVAPVHGVGQQRYELWREMLVKESPILLATFAGAEAASHGSSGGGSGAPSCELDLSLASHGGRGSRSRLANRLQAPCATVAQLELAPARMSLKARPMSSR